jgi:hypothetical protein
VTQLNHFRQQLQARRPSDNALLDAIGEALKATARGLFKIVVTMQRRCYKCGKERDQRIRQRQVHDDILMSAASLVKNRETGEPEKWVDVEDCISMELKNTVAGYYCDGCRVPLDAKFDAMCQKVGFTRVQGVRKANFNDSVKLATVKAAVETAGDSWEGAVTRSWRRIYALPEVLLLSVSHSGNDDPPKKLGTGIRLRPRLDLEPYLEESIKPQACEYRLVAIDSLKGLKARGNYKAQIQREKEQQDSNDKRPDEQPETVWREFNADGTPIDQDIDFDSIMTEQRNKVNTKTGAECRTSVSDVFNPYILMYERIDQDSKDLDNRSDSEDEEDETQGKQRGIMGKTGGKTAATGTKQTTATGNGNLGDKPGASVPGYVSNNASMTPPITTWLFDTPWVQKHERERHNRMQRHDYEQAHQWAMKRFGKTHSGDITRLRFQNKS